MTTTERDEWVASTIHNLEQAYDLLCAVVEGSPVLGDEEFDADLQDLVVSGVDACIIEAANIKQLFTREIRPVTDDDIATILGGVE